MIEHFHFLRPGWLLLLAPLGVLIWLLARGTYDSTAWRSVVDPRLLPFVLSGSGGSRRSWNRWIMNAVALLAIVALAGPTWERLPQPVYQKDTALVIMLDLSRSMNAADIRPGRLVRARHKIVDILKLRTEGQTGLVVFAADAFAVTPLTTDADTIMALLPDLDSTLMPAQGSRADRAFELAYQLFDNAGVTGGDLLLVSDGVDARVSERIESLRAARTGFRVSVLAVGTRDGGPVPLPNGGFLKAADGSIVISALREDNLRRLAADGGGVYAAISSDDLDINALAYLMETAIESGEASLAEDLHSEQWRELGPALLLIALPFAALSFRRGMAWLIPLCILVLPPDANAFDWQSLWQNDDQRASRLFEQGEHAAAARLFEDMNWKAASQYRAGDYQSALENWSRVDSGDALYNRGNALARMGRYDDALAAYDEVLQRQPGHEDALYNKQAIEDYLRNRPPQQGGQQQQEAAGNDGQKSDEEQNGQAPQGVGQAGDGAQQGGRSADAETGEVPAETNARPVQESSAEAAEESPDQAREDDAAPGSTAQPATQGEAGEDVASLDDKMSAQAAEQWLRKIPDDPGGLLRRKFRHQYRERGGVAAEEQTW